MIGQIIDGIEVTQEAYNSALKKLISCRKRNKKFRGKSEAEIRFSITDEDILKNIKSMSSLTRGNPKYNEQRVSITSVRDMNFSDDKFVGFTEAEQNFIKRKLEEYSNEYSLEKPNDKFLAKQVVYLELELEKLSRLRLSNTRSSEDLEKKYKDCMDIYLKISASLNVLKKQIATNKNNDNKNIGIANTLDMLDKSIEEMDEEYKKITKFKNEMLEKKAKR